MDPAILLLLLLFGGGKKKPQSVALAYKPKLGDGRASQVLAELGERGVINSWNLGKRLTVDWTPFDPADQNFVPHSKFVA